MSRPCIVRDEGGERSFAPADFPLKIGAGPDADIHVQSLQSPGILALLGLSDDEPFAQPGTPGIPVFLNERMLEESQWLRDGDTLRIESTRIH